jgi:hypothetical protein
MRAVRRRMTWVEALPFLAATLVASIGCGPGPQDPEAGTLRGSPLDRLPPEVTQLTDFGLRADWSPDGRRILFLDALAGDVWAYELGTKSLQELTALAPGAHGALRARGVLAGSPSLQRRPHSLWTRGA